MGDQNLVSFRSLKDEPENYFNCLHVENEKGLLQFINITVAYNERDDKPVRTSSLIDSACTSSLVGRKFLNRIRGYPGVKIENCTRTLVGAIGKQKVDNIVKLDFMLESSSSKMIIFNWTFYVSDIGFDCGKIVPNPTNFQIQCYSFSSAWLGFSHEIFCFPKLQDT